jgi:hypothetical protein
LGLISDMLFPDCKNSLISGGFGTGVELGDGCNVVEFVMGVDTGAFRSGKEQLVAIKALAKKNESKSQGVCDGP